MPGAFPGRVVGVEHQGCIANDAYQAGPIHSMMEKGMTSLTGAPAWTDVGVEVHDRVGGFFGGSFTVKVVDALASPFFFSLGSITWTAAVQLPPGTPLVSMLAVASWPVILPQVLVQL